MLETVRPIFLALAEIKDNPTALLAVVAVVALAVVCYALFVVHSAVRRQRR